MSLKLVVETLEGLNEHIAKLYEPIEGSNTFRLMVEGAVPRERLDEFRNKNIDLMKQLDTFKGIDAAKYNELLGLEKRLTDKELIEAGKVEEVVNNRIKGLKSEHEQQLNSLTTELTSKSSQLENILIDSTVRVKALENGVLRSAVDDVLLRAKQSFKIVDGQAIPHQDGKIVYGKDGVNPMSVDEWINTLAKNASHLFEQNRGGGAQGSNSTGRNVDRTKLTPAQKIAAGLASS